LTNIQAAMGVAQMEQLDEFIAKKRDIAARYKEGFKDSETITTMSAQPETDPTYWLYTILLDNSTTVETRKEVVRNLNEQGIGARPLWHPIHQLPPFIDCQAFEIECATNLYARAISLPSSVGLTVSDQERCIATVKEIALG
jgi:dTDP-4-amino-4,6-dideoxygalactose transaminase